MMKQNRRPPNISSYFQVDFLKYNKVAFEVWDLDGKEEVRPLWRHYLANTKYVLYVVDSTDREHIVKAKELLHSIFSFDHLENARLVIVANKQDLPDAMNEVDMERLLELDKLPSTCAR
jgi:ADP-ribosylation factor 1/2